MVEAGASYRLSVFGREGAGGVEIDQPPRGVARLGRAAVAGVLEALGLTAGDLLAEPVTAWTSRRKPLVPLREAERVNEPAPDFERILAAGLPATGLAHAGEAIKVIQGGALGRASEIRVRRAKPAEGTGWWRGGAVRFLEDLARALG